MCIAKKMRDLDNSLREYYGLEKKEYSAEPDKKEIKKAMKFCKEVFCLESNDDKKA